MEKSLPATSGGPKPGPLSLTIRTLDPTGRETCVIWSLIFSSTGVSISTSANVWITENSPPKTCRYAAVAINVRYVLKDMQDLRMLTRGR